MQMLPSRHRLPRLPLFACAFLWLLLSSCAEKRDHFVDARDIFILNPDTVETQISVNGTKAISISGPTGDIYLNAGEYDLTASQNGQEISKAHVSLDAATDDNDVDRFIWDLKSDRNWAVVDIQALYFDDMELEVVQKFFGESFLYIPCKSYRFYYPWSRMPLVMTFKEGANNSLYKLYELPKDKKEMSDEDVIAYVKELE